MLALWPARAGSGRIGADLRTIAAGVRPPRLDEGLAAALADLARAAPVPVELAASADRAPPEVEAAAYFVACEALTNAVKHAAPTRIVVPAARAGRGAPISGRRRAGRASARCKSSRPVRPRCSR